MGSWVLFLEGSVVYYGALGSSLDGSFIVLSEFTVVLLYALFIVCIVL
jgi:hypothetical protein